MSEPRTAAGKALPEAFDRWMTTAGLPDFRDTLIAAILAIEAEASQPLREWWGRVIAVVPAKYRAEFDEQFRAALAQPQQPVLREALDVERLEEGLRSWRECMWGCGAAFSTPEEAGEHESGCGDPMEGATHRHRWVIANPLEQVCNCGAQRMSSGPDEAVAEARKMALALLSNESPPIQELLSAISDLQNEGDDPVETAAVVVMLRDRHSVKLSRDRVVELIKSLQSLAPGFISFDGAIVTLEMSIDKVKAEIARHHRQIPDEVLRRSYLLPFLESEATDASDDPPTTETAR